jgi:hypothetical protein
MKVSEGRAKKRCVCGQSKIYPLCDGNHKAEGWMCTAIQDEANALAFVADPHLRNLADRLAHRFGGVSLHASTGPVRAHRLVILTAGLGIDYIRAARTRVQTDENLVIGIGVSEGLVNWAFPESHSVTVSSEPAAALWPTVVAAIEGVSSALTSQARPSVFISHSVADENAIFPPITALRDYYGLSIFVCADSIEPGSRWQDEIRTRLEASDLFLLINSQSVAQSTYCAYEVGVANGLGKPVRMVNLDESALPTYLAHIQAVSVPRLMERKPWLNPEDAILDGLLAAVSAPLE